jgi:predicted metal-binding membrane protein
MAPTSSLTAVLKRDRLILLLALICLAGLAWLSMLRMAWHMPGMSMAMAMPSAWGVVDFLLTFWMWVVMMVAMMIPSAAPMILTYATMHRRHREQAIPFVATGVFVSGYLLVWAGFSVVASVLQWGLHQTALLSSAMGRTGPVLGGILLMAAGVFQWTPLKSMCLRHCRSPLGFFMTEWREGRWGTLQMGLQHGSYCLGCCWILMGLLFASGVMNVLWMVLITVFILVEKVVLGGDLIGRLAGVGLVLGGLGLLLQGVP